MEQNGNSRNKSTNILATDFCQRHKNKREKVTFSINVKKTELGPILCIIYKNNLIMDHRPKPKTVHKTMKFLKKKKIGENHCDLGIGSFL